MKLPHFKYHPNVYELDLFEEEQGEWLSHCNEPCVFLGYADTGSIQPFYNEIKEKLIESGQNYSLEMLNNISKDGHVVGYLFQCAQCGKHKLHIDCD